MRSDFGMREIDYMERVRRDKIRYTAYRVGQLFDINCLSASIIF